MWHIFHSATATHPWEAVVGVWRVPESGIYWNKFGSYLFVCDEEKKRNKIKIFMLGFPNMRKVSRTYGVNLAID